MIRSLAPAAPPPGRDLALLRAMRSRVDPHDPRALNNLGVLYFTRGLYADAVEAFDRALAIDPRLRVAARNLEVAAAQPGACDGRLATLAAHLTAAPHDRDALLERARLTRVRGDRDEARRQLEALLAADPDDAAALFERALVEQRQGDLRRAQRWLERAVNAGAGAEARLLLAEVLYQRGQNEQALAAVDAVLAAQPQLADAHRLRGFVLGDMGRTADALAAARHAAGLDPRLESLDGDLSLAADVGPLGAAPSPAADPDAPADEPDGALTHYQLGLAFRQRGYFPEARREFERAAVEQEAPRRVSHALAELDLLEGEVAAARARYRALLDQEETARWWNEYGVAWHLDGNAAAAADAYRRALNLDPRDALAYNNLGVALADQGDAVAASEALARAADLDPAFVLARLNHARAEAGHGDDVAALTRLRDLVQFRPHEAEAWWTLALLLARRQRVDEALEAFRQALGQRPGCADAPDVLVRRYAGTGSHDEPAATTAGWSRIDLPLRLGIALQRECPDAVGAVDLLPPTGRIVPAGTVPGRPPEAGRNSRECASPACDEADDLAVRARYGEAAERYRHARALMAKAPTTSALWRRAALGEARSLCLQQQAGQARGLLEQLLADTPDDPEVCALYAAAVLAGEDEAVNVRTDGRARVREAILRVLRRETGSGALLHYTGEIALAIDDRELALACLRRALALDPTRPSPRVAIARLLRERGDLLAARLELMAALAAAPHCGGARLELARIEADAGRPAEARRVLVEHLARAPRDVTALALLGDVLTREGRRADASIVHERRRRLEADTGETRPAAEPRIESRARRARGARATSC